jgi:GDP-4-dehydro-6-deoxy-D-mannose reductase
LAQGYTVRGAALPGEPDDNVAHLGSRIRIDRFDIADREACRRYVTAARPDYLFHLAAIASVGKSFSMGETTIRVNTMGSYHIFDALRDKKWLKKLVFVSTSDVYGSVKTKDLPLRPESPIHPVSPYAYSKAAAELIAQVYIAQYGLPIVIVRAFNHTGPRQGPDFVIPSFSQKIAVAERSQGKAVIKVGNLAARRDIADVRDIVRGYRMLAEQGRIGGMYHLCSGRAFSIGHMLNMLLGFSDKTINVQQDKSLYRTIDIPVLRGSFDTTQQEIGWKPEIGLKTTLEDTLNFWRKRS